MGKRINENAFYWRSLRLYKVNLIRWAMMKSGGVIKGAAEELGLGAVVLRHEIEKLEGFGLNVRDVDASTPIEPASPTPVSESSDESQNVPGDSDDHHE